MDKTSAKVTLTWRIWHHSICVAISNIIWKVNGEILRNGKVKGNVKFACLPACLPACLTDRQTEKVIRAVQWQKVQGHNNFYFWNYMPHIFLSRQWLIYNYASLKWWGLTNGNQKNVGTGSVILKMPFFNLKWYKKIPNMV